MDLRAVFLKFSREESKDFVNYLKSQNKRSDSKSIALYKLLSNEKIKINTIPVLLYGVDNKNAYHAVRKRLSDSLVNFKSKEILSREESKEMTITKLLLLGRSFLQQQLYSQGVDLLFKAEKKAIEISNYALLNEVYHHLIAFQTETGLDLDLLIEKSTKNLIALKEEEKLNNAYAYIKAYYKDLNKPFYKDFETLLEELYDRFEVSESIRYSYRTVFQLSQIAHSFAIATKDYFSIEKFVLNSYNKVRGINNSQSKESYYELQILYIIANIYFRKKEFVQSIEVVKLMEKILIKEKKHINYFQPLMSCLKSLNLNYSNNYKAAFKELEIYDNNSSKYAVSAILDIQLCVVVYNFQQGEFRQAKKKLARLYHTDTWYQKQIGIEWVIKKNLIEILTHIELDDFEFVSSRIENFERKYVPFLKTTNKLRVITFLKFVKKIYINEVDPTTEEFKQELLEKFSWKLPIREDVFEMSFYAWLKSKIEKNNLYATTLDLVNMKT